MWSSKSTVLALILLAAVADGTAAGGELSTFIVHVHPHEHQVLASADDRDAWYRSFLPEAGRLVHAYHHVASGFAARLTPEELGALSVTPGFVAAVPDDTYELHTTHTPSFLGLDARQAQIANNGSDRGAGVIIGMLDTGILPTHPSFSDAGMPPPPTRWKGRCDFTGVGERVCNNKLVGARSFVSNDPRVQPVDDVGHGTHTASTAAGAVVPGANVLGQAAGVAAGMAPRAHVAMYKVCNEINCQSADVLAGMDAAVGDGCDIISMSIGGASRPFYKDTIAMAAFGAVEKGVFVAVSAGNSGPNASSVANDAPWILTVAASTMDRSIRATVRLGNGVALDGESAYQQPRVSESSSAAAFHPLVHAGASGKPRAELCGNGSLDGLDVEGKIVLCELGIGSEFGREIMIQKGAVVRRAGGAGMVLLNKFAQGYTTVAAAHVLPAAHVDYAAASAIESYVSATASPTAQILAGGTTLGTSPAPSIAFFSSRGPSIQNPGILKPDVTGPGVSVLAAWPFQVGPSLTAAAASPLPGPFFNFDSGTSMSTPHLSGIAAFVKSKHPDWSPAAIKSAIMTTADVADRAGYPILDEQREPAGWFATGAGHVNPEKAADPGLVYDIAAGDYVGFLCGLYDSQNVSLIARRPVDCSAVTVIQESMLNYPSISLAFRHTWNWSMPVTVERTVKNVGEVPSVYYAAVDMFDDDVSVGAVPRELEFSEENQEQRFKVVVWARRNNGRKVVQGALRWVSDTYTVRSPISVSFP